MSGLNQDELLCNCVDRLPLNVLQNIACWYRRRVDPRKRCALPDLITQTPSTATYIQYVPNAFGIFSPPPESIRYETCPKFTFDLEGLHYHALYYPKPSLTMLLLGIEDPKITPVSQKFTVVVFLNSMGKEEIVLETTIQKNNSAMQCNLCQKDVIKRLNISPSHIPYWMTATAIILRRNGWNIDGSSPITLYDTIFHKNECSLRDAIRKGIDAYPLPPPPPTPPPSPPPSKCVCVLQ